MAWIPCWQTYRLIQGLMAKPLLGFLLAVGVAVLVPVEAAEEGETLRTWLLGAERDRLRSLCSQGRALNASGISYWDQAYERRRVEANLREGLTQQQSDALQAALEEALRDACRGIW